MAQLRVSMILLLGAAGIALFNWSLFAANAAYQEVRRALAVPLPDEVTRNILAESPNALGGYYFAGLAGAAMSEHLQQQGYQHLSQARDMDQLLAWLANGDVDAILASNLSMERLLSGHQARPFVRALPYLDKPLVVYVNRAFSQAYPAFMPAFNQALAHCREQIPVVG